MTARPSPRSGRRSAQISSMGVAVVVYGVKERISALFYLEGLAVCLALPLLPLAVAYLILIPLMRIARPLRNKNAVMIAGGVLGIGLALAFSFYSQSMSARMDNPAWIRANLAGPDTVFARLAQVYLPAGLSWLALAGKGLASRAAALAGLIALGLAAASALVFSLGHAYTESLAGFDEQLLKRKAASKGEIKRLFKRRSIDRALVDREIKLMNREPIYFFNGPFSLVIMPLVLGVMYFAQKDNLSQISTQIAAFARGPGGLLSAAALGAFTGSATSITSTAFSRDAKALAYLKALPISGKRYAAAKWLHGLIFAALGVLIGTGSLCLLFGLDLATSAGAFVIALSFIAFANIAGLFLDALNPRLSWDTPTAAMKQNPNAGIFVIGLMGLMALIGLLSAGLRFGKLGFVLLYGCGFSLAALALGFLFVRYIEGRLAELEP